jgi:hypothetical protein
VILFTCTAEISTVDEEPIFRIFPLKLPFFQPNKKQKKEGQIKYPNQKQ